MPVVSVVLAGLMMRSSGAIRLGLRIACRRTPTAIGFRVYSLWTPDSRECGYSVCVYVCVCVLAGRYSVLHNLGECSSSRKTKHFPPHALIRASHLKTRKKNPDQTRPVSPQTCN